jgi:hypothetical protein
MNGTVLNNGKTSMIANTNNYNEITSTAHSAEPHLLYALQILNYLTFMVILEGTICYPIYVSHMNSVI